MEVLLQMLDQHQVFFYDTHTGSYTFYTHILGVLPGFVHRGPVAK